MSDAPAPDPTATEDSSRREELKAQITAAADALKAEMANRLDQFLDELGALI